MADKLITVKSFTTEIEAQIVRGRLQSEGIESFIIKDDCGGMYPHLHLTQGVLLKISEADLERALALIEPVDTPNKPPDQPSSVEETAAMMSVNAWILGIIAVGLMLAGIEDIKWLYTGLAIMVISLALKLFSRPQ